MTDTQSADTDTIDLTAARIGPAVPFNEGELVDHIRHGTSRYGGIRLLEAGGIVGEYLQLEYAGGDRIYVPIQHLDRVHKRAGQDGEPAKLARTPRSESAHYHYR